jgi:NitT/TauT family transport system substrate-binding protein
VPAGRARGRHASGRRRSDLVRKIDAASLKGFEDAVKDPAAAVAAPVKLAPLVDRETIRRQLAVDLGLLYSAANKQMRLGYGPPEDWASTLEVLKKYRDVETNLPATASCTNEVLP